MSKSIFIASFTWQALILLLFLLALKLTSHITSSWWLVLSPVLVLSGLVITILIFSCKSDASEDGNQDSSETA